MLCDSFITASHSFPFVKKRIEVTEKREIVLSPIEVAIDEMTTKVIEIREVVDLVMPDMKKLQLKLQGSVSAQVLILWYCLHQLILLGNRKAE